MKKNIARALFPAILIAVLVGCASDTGPEEAVIDWIDPGFESNIVRFEAGGGDLYRIEAMTEDMDFKYGFVDRAGKVIIPVIYDRTGEFSEGLCYVEMGDEKAYIDTSGKEVLDMSEYVSAGRFEFGFAPVRRQLAFENNGSISHSFMMGLIDKSGDEVLPCEYDEAGAFGNGVLWAERNGKYYVFDDSGNSLTSTAYDYIGDAGDAGMLVAELAGQMGYLDREGNVTISFEFDRASPFFDGAAMVAINGQISYINMEGEKLTSETFETGYDFSEGLCVVERESVYGYINTTGELQIPLQYDEAYNFSNGVATVVNRINGKLHFSTINKNGDIAIVPEEQGFFKWNDAYIAHYNPSELGEIDVDLDNMALLDSSGKILTGFYYSDIGDFVEGLAVALFYPGLGARYELLNKYGAVVAPFEFEKMEILNGRSCIVQWTDYAAEGNNSRVGILSLPKDAANKRQE